MSHIDYVAQLDEDQLTELIRVATAKREEILQSGWVKLWTVNVGWANIAWFPQGQRAAALKRACEEVEKYASQWPGQDIEMEVSLESYRPGEVAELLGKDNAAIQAAAQGEKA